MIENIKLKNSGAIWYHTCDWEGPNLSKASLGEFFFVLLSEGVQIGNIWVMNHKVHKSSIMVSVFMTEDMKVSIESKTKYRFRLPPKISLN